jgi:hypothetical protein
MAGPLTAPQRERDPEAFSDEDMDECATCIYPGDLNISLRMDGQTELCSGTETYGVP